METKQVPEPARHDISLKTLVQKKEFYAANKHLFTWAQFDAWVRMRHGNGLTRLNAVINVGANYYINEPQFIEWMLERSRVGYDC